MMIMILFMGSIQVFADDSDSLVGVWKLIEMTGEQNVMSREDLQEYEELGVVMYLKLRDNGTAKFALFGDEMEGYWSEYGIVLDDSWLSYELKDGQLTIVNIDGGKMIFERSSMDEVNKILGYQEGVLDEKVSYSQKEKKILDTDEASVYITGYEANMTGFTVRFRCKNKLRRSIVISEDKCVLNKYIFEPGWAISLDSKETLDSEMTISPIELENCGISRIDEMILELRLSNGGNLKTIRKGLRSYVYPTGKKAKDIKPPVRTPLKNERTLINNKDCTFIIESTESDHNSGFIMKCYAENKTGHKLTLTMNAEAINGKAVSSGYKLELLPKTKGYTNVVFMNSAIEEKGLVLTDVSRVKATLRVVDSTLKKPQKIAEKTFVYQP